MCGLFGGLSSTILPDERAIINQLMIFNYTRGEDSTGMFDFVPEAKKISNNESPWRFWKSTSSPLDFARTAWFKAEENRWKKAQPMIIAGHTRAATKGKITQENAHPFYHKPVIGMHNGTIYGKFHNSDKFETDSEALIHNIGELGIEETIKDLKNAGSAAYAIVWINCKENTLNFLRNDRRPLHFAREGKDGNLLLWSSEEIQLEHAVKYLKDSHKWEIHPLPINKHHSFPLGEGYLTEPEVKDLAVPFVPVVVSGVYSEEYQGVWGEKEWESYASALAERERKKAEEESSSEVAEDGVPWDNEEEIAVTIDLRPEDKLTEPYLTQYSRKHKDGIFCRWDVASQRWFTVWGLQQLQNVRRRKKEVTVEKAKAVVSPDLNDSMPDLTARSAKDNWELAAPWFVNGDEVDYKTWLQATKNGCTWERCPLVHNTEAIWISREYVLCEKHAREALNKNGELHEHFANNVSEIKSGLKHFKKRLLNEIALRTAAIKK